MKDTDLRLDSFDPTMRAAALSEMARSGSVNSVADRVNMHVHSFCSFNCYGWSPSRIAVECSQAGLWAAGLCDFDVLDGLEEFFDAGELLGLRTAVNLETRTFYGDLASVEIDSPGEPGVSYMTGAGFVRRPEAGSVAGQFLDNLRQTAQKRNRELIARINPHVGPLAIDYDLHVLPLTPLGNATERHIVTAYCERASALFADSAERAALWAKVLGIDLERAKKLDTVRADLEGEVRSRLAKKGGVGYVQPTAGTFPPVESFFAWVKACDAIPMESWLDGTSAGEQDGRALLERSMAKGAAALNLIPDRNWNIGDPALKARKVDNLAAIVQAANELQLPINIGTELNRTGQSICDNLQVPDLAPFAHDFVRGAQIMVGHTTLARFAGVSYAGDDALGEFGGSLEKKNAFFAAVGSLPPISARVAQILRELGIHRAWGAIHDSAGQGQWQLKNA